MTKMSTAHLCFCVLLFTSPAFARPSSISEEEKMERSTPTASWWQLAAVSRLFLDSLTVDPGQGSGIREAGNNADTTLQVGGARQGVDSDLAQWPGLQMKPPTASDSSSFSWLPFVATYMLGAKSPPFSGPVETSVSDVFANAVKDPVIRTAAQKIIGDLATVYLSSGAGSVPVSTQSPAPLNIDEASPWTPVTTSSEDIIDPVSATTEAADAKATETEPTGNSWSFHV